jgi:hypothetical protein
MKSSTPHINAARVVAVGPIEKLHVCLVKLSTSFDCLVAIAFNLSRPQASRTIQTSLALAKRFAGSL